MQRSLVPEIMDDPAMPEETRERFHRDLGSLHRFLGNQNAILNALRRDPLPVGRVLDIGCGNGDLLDEIHRALGVTVMGVELRAPQRHAFGFPIVVADATRDLLPEADVAVCVMVIHHLSEDDIIALIRNVGCAVRRMVILDLVRHRLPLALFRMFVVPFIGYEVGTDGLQSVRRAYTPAELRAIVESALAGSDAHFEQTITPLRSRQMIDISWR